MKWFKDWLATIFWSGWKRSWCLRRHIRYIEEIPMTRNAAKLVCHKCGKRYAIDEILRNPKYRDCSRYGVRQMIEREANRHNRKKS